MRRKKVILRDLSVFVGLILAFGGFAQSQSALTENILKGLTFRNIGPFRMGARTSDIAVPDTPAKDHLYTFYVATWTGGFWKTTNNGTTFEPVFDDQSKLTIGDVTLAPSNPDIVWVGTGDGFCSRSSYAGRRRLQVDGRRERPGRTWASRIRTTSRGSSIHPKNPDIVYVASMGHLYLRERRSGACSRRSNGGQTWDKVLYVNEKVGVIDLVMNPQNPDILYAATYDKQRLPWQYVNGGPESGIYKTTDGGKTWTRLGGGLPAGHDRPDRARHLPQESGHRLRRHRKRQHPSGRRRRRSSRTKPGGCEPRDAGRSAARSTGPRTAARPGPR